MGCHHSVFHLEIEGAMSFTRIGGGLIPAPKSRNVRCLPQCFTDYGRTDMKMYDIEICAGEDGQLMLIQSNNDAPNSVIILDESQVEIAAKWMLRFVSVEQPEKSHGTR